ncbi:MFS transporter [Streptomyces sp. SID3915]|uniref:MFS transporter n=1 Tax=Streptomyces sp. SID3915 TaxID=2690263 RepID=UPI00081B725D|nr:MFS transporter [Streptomyces sp. SID3915]MYX76692.1 MFS transporter [Streptomyces sp. SID3915]SCD96135.1 drug resistance transporter, EmrB/QacA subfamily [Streptomyces sp. BpilaLS-43]
MRYRRPAPRVWTAAVVCAGLFMLGMDVTILNVAVPELRQGLPASTAQVQWIVDGYALVLGGTVLSVGAFTDSWGRRRSFLSGVALCGAASWAGAEAAAPWQLIAARCFMGAGAALLMPATLAVIHHTFPEPGARARAIAAWAAVGGLGGLGGPLIGGWLVEQFSWRAAFWINVPLAAVIVAGAAFLVPESRAARRKGFDGPGAALSAGGLLALVWAVIEGPHRGWASAATLTGFGVAAVLLAAFVLRQARTPDPMLPLGLLRAPHVWVAATALTLMSFALFGALFVLTLYLQGVLGYGPLEAGVRTVPLPAALAAGAVCALPLLSSRRPGPGQPPGVRLPVSGGLVVVTLGFLVLATTDATSGYPRCLVFQLVAGFGAGLVAAAATESVMGSLPSDAAALGSAVNDSTRQLGSALGIAVQGSLLTTVFTDRAAALVPGSASPPLTDTLGPEPADVPEPLRAAVALGVREAFTDAMTVTALAAGTVTAVAAVLAARGLRPPAAPAPPVPSDGRPVSSRTTAAP